MINIRRSEGAIKFKSGGGGDFFFFFFSSYDNGDVGHSVVFENANNQVAAEWLVVVYA